MSDTPEGYRTIHVRRAPQPEPQVKTIYVQPVPVEDRGPKIVNVLVGEPVTIGPKTTRVVVGPPPSTERITLKTRTVVRADGQVVTLVGAAAMEDDGE